MPRRARAPRATRRRASATAREESPRPSPSRRRRVPRRAPEPKPRRQAGARTPRSSRMRRALERFNASEQPRTVAGLDALARHAAVAAVASSRRRRRRCEITVAWELSWYQLGGRPRRRAASRAGWRKGAEVDELADGRADWNARDRRGGRLRSARSERLMRCRQRRRRRARATRARPRSRSCVDAPRARCSRSAASRSARRPTTSPSTARCSSGIERAARARRHRARAGRRLGADRRQVAASTRSRGGPEAASRARRCRARGLRQLVDPPRPPRAERGRGPRSSTRRWTPPEPRRPGRLYSAARAAVAQLARASACHAEGRGFESHQPLFSSPISVTWQA